MALAETFGTYVQKLKDLWADFDLKQWSQKIGGTSAEAIQAAVYFGLFFAIGFLFKKYFKFVFTCLVMTLIIAKVLEYNNFAMLDWPAMKQALGMGPTGDMNVVVNTCVAWVKENILVFIASTVGFLVGYKLG